MMKKKLLSLLIAALMILAVTGCGNSEKTKEAAETQKKAVETKADNTSAKVEKPLLQEDLKAVGFITDKNEKTYENAKYTSTYGISDDGYLLYVDLPGATGLYIIDKKNNQIAQYYDHENPGHGSALDIYSKQYENGIQKQICNIVVRNDNHNSQDAILGAWYEGSNTHFIPLYILYEFNNNGNIVIKDISSGTGYTPSHYQGPVADQKHKDLVKLLFDQMDDFRKVVKTNNVKLNRPIIAN